ACGTRADDDEIPVLHRRGLARAGAAGSGHYGMSFGPLSPTGFMASIAAASRSTPARISAGFDVLKPTANPFADIGAIAKRDSGATMTSRDAAASATATSSCPLTRWPTVWMPLSVGLISIAPARRFVAA